MKTATQLFALLVLLGATQAAAQNVTAVEALRGTTINNGIYANTIPNMNPPRPYTEICFVNGSILSEGSKAAQSPTAGGPCDVGDIGWIVESDNRAAATWDEAKADCLRDEMRLPELFEFAYSCANATLLNLTLNDIIDDHEWAANEARTMRNNDEGGTDRVQIATLGLGDCRNASAFLIDTATTYRCAR